MRSCYQTHSLPHQKNLKLRRLKMNLYLRMVADLLKKQRKHQLKVRTLVLIRMFSWRVSRMKKLLVTMKCLLKKKLLRRHGIRPQKRNHLLPMRSLLWTSGMQRSMNRKHRRKRASNSIHLQQKLMRSLQRTLGLKPLMNRLLPKVRQRSQMNRLLQMHGLRL